MLGFRPYYGLRALQLGRAPRQATAAIAYLGDFKPFPPRAPLTTQRWSSTVVTGENESGHIYCGPNESILFLDSVYPLGLLQLRWLLRLPYLNADRSVQEVHEHLKRPSLAAYDPIETVKRAIPDDLSINVKEIIPRVKEGGSFVKFSYDPQLSLQDIESTVRKYLKEHPVKPAYNPWKRVRGFLVQGKPWIEDLYRFPSPRIKVEFLPTEPGGAAAELSQEQLYSLLRKYGKIVDIASQPADSKALPRYASVTFRLQRQAIMARNCMHGFVLPETEGGGKAGTLLRINYEKILKARWIRDWIASHPRVFFPILAAIVAAITVAIFDPVRTWFIKVHVTHSFQISDNSVYKWFRSQLSRANDILSFKKCRSEDASMEAIWDDRKEDIKQIKTWLMETADTFIVVQGPRGSGKRELVIDEALKGRKNTLIIDCKPIQEARGDNATINATAKAVGYRPVFSWMNSISSMLDLAAQGAIGTKTGFSETVDTQLAKIFQNTATALRQIALEHRDKDDKDRDLGDDEYLEAHPEHRPVIVIDNFLHKSNESNLVYDKLSEWAASMTTANVAHVIFLTHDVSFSKSLSKALPDRVFRQISLGDCSPDVAKRYVLKHLDADADTQEGASEGEKSLPPSQSRSDLQELDDSVGILGGRLTDLEFLARRIKTGETPNKAVQEIIDQSASEILKMYLLDTDASGRIWTPQQAWYLIKALAYADTIRYNAVLLSDTYKTGGDAMLQALEQAELIAIGSRNGRPHSIRPGRPVYGAAFQSLTRDRVLAARLDLAVLAELIGVETKAIEKCEAELSLLGALPKQPGELAPRTSWLLEKVRASQAKVVKYEEESAALKKVLLAEY